MKSEGAGNLRVSENREDWQTGTERGRGRKSNPAGDSFDTLEQVIRLRKT
jgi:hypothetical protein